MTGAERAAVIERSGGRCEYCGLPQSDSFFSFHVEHIVARQHGGSDDQDNLALACRRCNLYKGPNLTALDPETGQITPLFHPRRDHWSEHFSQHDAAIVGLTPQGRATARLLRMNAEPRADLRREIVRGPDV